MTNGLACCQQQEDVWAHLNVLYDLELLEEKEAPEEDSDSEERK